MLPNPLDFLYLTTADTPVSWDNSPPNTKVAGLIKRWNEENNIAVVLNNVGLVDWLAQIVVVNDGSTDNTLKVAQACGLILNELVTNSLKYAFPTKVGNITITLTQLENGVKELSVKDDGIGIASFTDIQNVKALGMRLVVNLVKQIKGSIEILSHEGTEIIIRFKNP